MTDPHIKAREIAAKYCSGEKVSHLPEDCELTKDITTALEAERKAVFEEIATKQALIHGESVMLNGKVVTNEELYKQPTDYVKEAHAEGYRRGLEDAADELAKAVKALVEIRLSYGPLIVNNQVFCKLEKLDSQLIEYEKARGMK